MIIRRRDWFLMPRLFCDPGLITQHDIAVTRASKLRMKLLVFHSLTSMRAFWSAHMPQPICRDTHGVVWDMRWIVEVDGREVRWEVDPRYFAVMGLAATKLSMNIITHECVHAAFAYSRRVKPKWPGEPANEEAIAYPAGFIGRKVVAHLNKFKLL